MNTSVKHISLDVWQTLIHSNLDFRKKRNQLLADHFKISKPFDAVEEAAKARQAWCTEANQLVGKNFDSFEIALLILQDCGVSLNEISTDRLIEFYEQMEVLFLEFPPNIIEDSLPKQLNLFKEKNISVSLLSNTGLIKGRSLRKFFQRYDLYFDFELYSDEIGFSKPNVSAFNLVLEKANTIKAIIPTEIVHIGDNKIADYEGALSIGFQAQLIDHNQSTLQSFITKQCI